MAITEADIKRINELYHKSPFQRKGHIVLFKL